MYEVVGANGKLRPTTLRDAKKLNLVPSVTTIIRCADRPGLNRWMRDQMLHAALTLPRTTDESEEAWIERVWADSEETARKAADKGTQIHAAIQGFYEGKETASDLLPHVLGARDAIQGHFGLAMWCAERSFAHQLGFGGKVDLSSNLAAVDFKTKEFGEEDELKTWDEHAMQLAAYREGLGMPEARAAIVYVSVTNPGLSRLIEIPEEELERGWECFIHLLSFWKARNRYRCGFDISQSQAA